MTNTELLEQAIAESGLKKSFLAMKLGVSRQSFTAILAGKKELRASQIYKLSAMLRLTNERRDAIFFAEPGA